MGYPLHFVAYFNYTDDFFIRHLRQYHEEREGKGIKTTEYFLGEYLFPILTSASQLISLENNTLLSILGFYSKEKHEENKKIDEDSEFRKPLMKKIEAFNLPYYELIMNDGTICDLNGQPRVTRVHYVISLGFLFSFLFLPSIRILTVFQVCYPTGKNEVYSLKESSTCEYEVVVLTPLLCNHPDYRPEETSERYLWFSTFIWF